MKLHKFLHTSHVSSIASGTLLFKSIHKFRDMLPPIGDPDEGMATIDADHYQTKGGLPNPFGPLLTVGPNVSFRDVKFVYPLGPCYISCFSIGDIAQLSKIMLHSPPENYDASVTIRDEAALIDEIAASGTIRDLGSFAKNIRHMCGGAVNYVKRHPKPPYSQQFIQTAPWRKMSAYRQQCEFRIVLTPAATLPDEFFVDCPSAARLISISRDGTAF